MKKIVGSIFLISIIAGHITARVVMEDAYTFTNHSSDIEKEISSYPVQSISTPGNISEISNIQNQKSIINTSETFSINKNKTHFSGF